MTYTDEEFIKVNPLYINSCNILPEEFDWILPYKIEVVGIL